MLDFQARVWLMLSEFSVPNIKKGPHSHRSFGPSCLQSLLSHLSLHDLHAYSPSGIAEMMTAYIWLISIPNTFSCIHGGVAMYHVIQCIFLP
jgi:hypothetical protein